MSDRDDARETPWSIYGYCHKGGETNVHRVGSQDSCNFCTKYLRWERDTFKAELEKLRAAPVEPPVLSRAAWKAKIDALITDVSGDREKFTYEWGGDKFRGFQDRRVHVGCLCVTPFWSLSRHL